MNSILQFFFNPTKHLWATRMALLGCVLALTTLSVLFVNSTTGGAADATVLTVSARNQLLKAAVGLFLLLVILTMDYRHVERVAYYLYFILLVLLVGLLAYKRIAGVKRWFELGLFNLQPSELMKVTLIVTLASYLRFRKDQRRLAGLVRPFLWTFVPMVLVVAQPDLGTSLMLPPILLAMLFVSGARRSHLGYAVLAGALMVPAVVLVHTSLPTEISERFVRPYQAKRVYSWLAVHFPKLEEDNPSLRDRGHQLRQSRYALISGGLGGQGYGRGMRNRLSLLPACQTDFIFAIIGEEWGFLGAGSVVALLWLVVILCFRVAYFAREPFARLVATGVGTLFAAQSLQNLGMTMGLTPITGLPLPFVSFGGSSMVSSYLAIAVVLAIAYRPVLVMASQDLNPRDERRAFRIVDFHPAGANRIPNGPY